MSYISDILSHLPLQARLLVVLLVVPAVVGPALLLFPSWVSATWAVAWLLAFLLALWKAR